MAIDRAKFAQECVRQGALFGIEPHYLLGAAQLRSGINDDNDGDKIGAFRLTQAEWDANRDNNEFDVHFTSAHITSTIRQCVVAGLMAHRAFDAFVAANNRNPSAKELYLQQWPNADATGLQQALNDTAALVDPAAGAVLDDPQSIAPVANAEAPATGPFKKMDPGPVAHGPAGPGMLTLAMLQQRWPNAPAALIQGMANTAGVLEQLGINTPLRMAHFMAQISHECGKGTVMVENLNYSAQRMMQVFPKRFPDLASTAGFANNPQAFGNKVYNGRMGNRVGSDDGFNFRGRGCLQITGRDNYTTLGKSCGLDLVNNPNLATDPANVLLIAATEFVKSGCLPDCDQDNLVRVSARINVGNANASAQKINGLADRQAQLAVWKQVFGV
jgi:putative chitinase